MILAMLAVTGASVGQPEAWAPTFATDSLAGDPAQPPATSLATGCDRPAKSGDGGPAYLRSSAGLGRGYQAQVTATTYWIGAGKWKVVPQRLCLGTSAGQYWFQVSEVLAEQP